MRNIFDQASKVYDYRSFVSMAEHLLADGKTTGDNQTEEYLFYAKLNLQRMRRWDKTFTPRAELVTQLKESPLQTWWVITEAWCGDSAQNLPALAKMAEAAEGNIKLSIVLRDEHPEIMSRYLTHGSRSIPVLVSLNQLKEEQFRWGPRPLPAQQLLLAWKNAAEPQPFELFEKEMHQWYTADKGHTLQDEISALLQK